MLCVMSKAMQTQPTCVPTIVLSQDAFWDRRKGKWSLSIKIFVKYIHFVPHNKHTLDWDDGKYVHV